MQNPLFFVAIIPPKGIQEKVTSFKEYASRKFNSSHALKSPPHVTVIAPFRWDLKKLKSLKNSLWDFAKTQTPFSISLNGWDHFSDRVIFIDVEPNGDLMDCQFSLATHLNTELELKKDLRPYHPHMTVAFRDLKAYYFEKAWAHFSFISFHEIFEANELILLRHNGERWDVFDCFSLNESSN